MGFYFRRSVRMGPLRFNFSAGGIGVSTGVPGLRIGTGPRGSYVHAGANGFYYRQSLSTVSRRSDSQRPTPHLETPAGTEHDGMVDVDSVDVMKLVDASSADLLNQIAEARKGLRYAPWIVGLALAIALVVPKSVPSSPQWMTWVVVGVGMLGAGIAAYFDAIRKTVVLFYDFDEPARARYQRLHDEFRKFAANDRAWHVQAQANSRDRKYTSGAGTIVQRKAITLAIQQPAFVKANIEVPSIPVGAQTLYFFPDRLFVVAANGVGAVDYSDLVLKRSLIRFAETGVVPRDCRVVGRTWRYVNKAGGPDRRFKENQEIPWVNYREVALQSNSGLNELIQLSRSDGHDELEVAIAELSRAAVATAPQEVALRSA